jgi:methylenetetrahydrofolate dehydrogenase (NADP+) / methenyltetrahydrofolate cyclohydrolase
LNQWGNQIKGGPQLGLLKKEYEKYRALLAAKNKQVAIVRFEPPPGASQFELAQYEAAAVSMRQKVKTFGNLNTPVKEYVCTHNITKEDFEALIRQSNADKRITGIIVQLPTPDKVKDSILLIDRNKDIDALGINSRFSVGATAEGIVRIAQPFIDNETTVAVVGAEGFVGESIIRLLQQKGVNYIPLDRGDDLLRVREADIVISVTGQPEVLDERHLRPIHRLVIDSGFVPIDGEILGDIKKSAYDIPQNLTPVPGGTGPIEMMVLMERLVQKEIDPQITLWEFPVSEYLSRAEVESIQLGWAESIKETAQTVYAAFRSRTLQVAEESTNVEQVRTQDYLLLLNREEKTLSLQSAVGDELAKFDLEMDRVISASGISKADISRWRQVQKVIEEHVDLPQNDFER